MIKQNVAITISDHLDNVPFFDIYVRNADGEDYPPMTCYYEQNLQKLSKREIEGLIKELDYIKGVLQKEADRTETCPYCHKVFKKTRKNQRFCKERCRTSFARRKCEQKNPKVPHLRYLRRLGEVK